MRGQFQGRTDPWLYSVTALRRQEDTSLHYLRCLPFNSCPILTGTSDNTSQEARPPADRSFSAAGRPGFAYSPRAVGRLVATRIGMHVRCVGNRKTANGQFRGTGTIFPTNKSSTVFEQLVLFILSREK